MTLVDGNQKQLLKCTIQLKINGRDVTALVDTGAMSSFITLQQYDGLRLAGLDLEMRSSAIRVMAANNTELNVVGETTVPMYINEECYHVSTLIVNTPMLYPVILGMNFLKENECIINIGSGSMHIQSPQLQDMAYLSENIVVPPFSECAVAVNIVSSVSNKTISVERYDPLLVRFGVSIMPGIVELSADPGHPCMLVIANLTSQEVTLERLTKVASICKYDASWVNVCGAQEFSTRQCRVDSAQDPIMQVNNAALTDEQKQRVNQLINVTYRDIFADKTLPSRASGVEHEINTGNHRPFNSAPSRVSQREREQVHIQVQDMLAKGIIRQTRSPWASRVVLVKKKDGKLRFCVDYRALNKLTKRDQYPLPRIDDSLAALQRGKFFSSLDLFAGYWQIPMHEASKEKTAFVCGDGLFEFNVMPFGLCNAPATFQRFMDVVLAGLKWQSLLVYLDDIIIFSPSAE